MNLVYKKKEQCKQYLQRDILLQITSKFRKWQKKQLSVRISIPLVRKYNSDIKTLYPILS